MTHEQIMTILSRQWNEVFPRAMTLVLNGGTSSLGEKICTPGEARDNFDAVVSFIRELENMLARTPR
jgi:hypothetical protein